MMIRVLIIINIIMIKPSFWGPGLFIARYPMFIQSSLLDTSILCTPENKTQTPFSHIRISTPFKHIDIPLKTSFLSLLQGENTLQVLRTHF